MAGKSSTISSSQPAAGNLRVQTAVYGAVIPQIYGRTRVSGNLIWYGGFQAVPHTTTTSSGGKGGGGVKTQNTTYTYQAAVAMALGEGAMNGVITAWRGKAQYSPVPQTSVLQTLNVNATVPGGGVVSVPGFLNNVQVVAPLQSEPYDTYSPYGNLP